jgi:hypothetical protein
MTTTIMIRAAFPCQEYCALEDPGVTAGLDDDELALPLAVEVGVEERVRVSGTLSKTDVA